MLDFKVLQIEENIVYIDITCFIQRNNMLNVQCLVIVEDLNILQNLNSELQNRLSEQRKWVCFRQMHHKNLVVTKTITA